MNIPAMAKKTYDELKSKSEFLNITLLVKSALRKIESAQERARFVHQAVDEFNKVVFSHPLVKEFSPCKAGCSACCHTQVSVTKEEAELLYENLLGNASIDIDKLLLQAQAQNSSQQFYKLSFKERGCVFLDEVGNCQVYSDRPAVCRTNAVVGSSDQCMSSGASNVAIRSVRTPHSDMAIVAAYQVSEEAGTLPFLLAKTILEKSKTQKNTLINSFLKALKKRKAISKDLSL